MEGPAHPAAGLHDEAGANARQREGERRVLDAHSFDEAVEYLAELERLAGDPDPDDVVVKALSMAAVIAYARPFSGQRDRHGRREHDFEDLYLEVLEMLDGGRALHDHVLGLRNQYLAHYDAARARVELPEGDGPVRYMAPTPLRPEQAKQLRLLAGTMSSRTLGRARELRSAGQPQA